MAEQTKKRSVPTGDQTSTTENPKKKKPSRSSEEGKQSKKESGRQQGKTRVSVGIASPLWGPLKGKRD